MSPRIHIPSRSGSHRRSFLLASLAAPWLAACGGGAGAPTPAPPAERRGSFSVVPASFTASQHTASLAPGGHVILVGGSRGESTLSSAVDRFDPGRAAFSRIGELQAGRAAHRATSLTDGGILITGGLRSSGSPRDAELVDPLSGAVRAAGTMSVSRIDHAALRLADGRVLLTGGYSTGERAPLGISDSAEIWDAVTGAFRRLATRMTTARAAHTATLLPSGQVLIAGGFSPGGAYAFAELFDPATETFTALRGGGAVRANHAAHMLADGRVIVAGGETPVGDSQAIEPLDSVMVWSPATREWQGLPGLSAPRTMAAGVGLASGELLLLGGQTRMPAYAGDVEALAPGSRGQACTPLDGGRALHTATLLPDGRVLVAGGEAFGADFRSTALLYRP